jgi:hypothetical protein
MKLLILLAFTAVLVRAEHAHACSCGMPRIEISPTGTDAPTNSTVVAWVPSYVLRDTGSTEINLSVRKKSGDTITVDYKKLGSASVTVIEMTPKGTLSPNTEYEIVRLDGETASVVGSFSTGAREEHPGKGIAKANYYKAVPVCCMCMTSDPYAQIELKEKIDDKRATQYRVGIWIAGSDGKIDYKKPPVTYEQTGDTLWLGHPSTCSPANFLFPKSKTLKLGVKLVDLAGNASTASEFVLDTTKPVRPPDN